MGMIQKPKIKYPLVFITILCLLVGSLWFVFLRSKEAEAAWFDESWMYRQRVDITNSGSATTNQYVKITLNTSALISVGKMQSDCDDIRVTDINGKLLDHWDTNCNTTSTLIYVKTLSLPTSGAVLYLYYSNPSATNIEKALGSSDYPGTSCEMMKDQGSVTSDGAYYIVPGGNDSDKIQVYCDVTTLSEGWTLVLNNNKDLTTNPEPVWDDAVNSINTTGTFGSDLTAFDLILGLKHYNYTGSTAMVQVGTSPTNITKRATYSSISLNTGSNYALSLGTETLYLGASTPGIKNYHAANNYQFTTSDADHDVHEGNCSHSYGNSPWWYGACWSGSFWGGGDSGGHQNAPYWVGSSDDYHNYGAIYVGGADTMKNVSAGSPTNEETGPGPVAYWKFDEGYGDTTYDSTQNGNNGSRTDATWQSEDMCISGKCLYFDGDRDYITISSMTFERSGGTICFWYKSLGDYTGNYEARGTVISTGTATSKLISLRDNGTNYRWEAESNTNGDYILATSYLYEKNKWRQLCMVADNNTVYSYLDAQLIDTEAADDDMLFSIIGAGDYDDADPTRYQSFHGYLDEIKVYPYARSVAEIKADYAAGLSGMGASKGTAAAFGGSSDKWLSDGLVGYWKMDESGATAIDSSGNGHDGSVTSATVAAGVYGNGKNFDGIDDIITISSQPTFTSEVTVSAWVYWSDGNSAWGLIGSPCEEPWYSWGLRPHQFVIRTSSNPGSLTTAGDSIVYDEWEFLTGTYDGSYVKFYRNGQLVQSTPGTGSISYSGSLNVIDMGGWISSASHWMDGKIDEVRIYNHALSPKEVRDLYNWAPGPVGYWNFDEHTGTSIVYDRSGNGNNGTIQGSMTESDWVLGKFGSALDFDGDDDNISIPESSSLKPIYQITMEAWVNPDDYSGDIIVLGKGAYYFTVNSDGQLCTYWYSKSSQGYHCSGTNGDVPTATWSYIAVAWDDAGPKIYVNGILKNSVSSTGTGNVMNTEVWIGAETDGGTRQFNGKIDDVRIYNYARTSKQIVEDMNAGHPAVGSPVGTALLYFNLDEGYGTTANDSGYNGDNGVIADGPSWTNSGKFNKGLSLDGLNDRIQGFTSDPFEYTGGDLTLSVWFKPNASDTDVGRIISKPWNSSSQYNYYILLNSDDTLTFQLQGATAWTTTTTDTVTNGEWQHIAVTVNGNTSAVKIYKNGIVIKSDTHNITDWTPSVGDSNLSLCIGCLYPYDSPWGGATSHCVQGEIDELKIYTAALTEDEIRVDYNRGAAILMGTTGTESDGSPSYSSERSYCPPGDTTASCAPVGEWKMDEKTGTTANDTSGNGNTGTITDATWKSAGECKVGACLNFDGTNDKVQTSNSIITGTGDFTITAWVNRSVSGTTDYIAGNYGTGSCLDGVEFYAVSANNLYVYIGGSVASTGTLNADTWYHVAVTRSTGSIKLYIDGKQDGSGTLSGSIGGNCNLAIGNGPNYTSERFEGKIDHVKIYDYARTQAQIAWDYNRGKPVGWWKFDEGEGMTAHDASGNANDGTLEASMTSDDWVDGKYNTALDFDGGDDYVDLDAGKSFGSTDTWTASLWLKEDSGHSGNWSFFFGESGTSAKSIVYSTGNYLSFRADDGNYVYGPSVIRTNLNHIVVTYNNGTFYFYLNGIQNGPHTKSTTAIFTGIGYGYSGIHKFDGLIDDVKIFNYALTANQVKILFNEGSTVRFGPN